MWLFHLSSSSSESTARSHRSFLSLHILVHFLGAESNRVYFKTQGWLALHGGGGGCVTLLYVHRWSAILACLDPDSLWLCFGWRRDEIMCVGKCMSERSHLRCWTLTSGGGGVLLLLVMAKLRDCLVGGVCLVRDWFEVMLFWLPCSLGGVVFGHTYNEGHVFYLADILMQITLGIITIRGTKAKGAVVIDRIYFFWHTTFLTFLAISWKQIHF